MPKVVYTAGATVTGGRADGHGRTSDGGLKVDLRLPSEMGGEGGGSNPEQLFALGFALAVALDVTLPTVEDAEQAVRLGRRPTPAAGPAGVIGRAGRCAATQPAAA